MDLSPASGVWSVSLPGARTSLRHLTCCAAGQRILFFARHLRISDDDKKNLGVEAS